MNLKVTGVRSQHDYVVSHSKDTLFVQKITKNLEEWIEKKQEIKCYGDITSFTFDEKSLYVTLGPHEKNQNRLIVLGLTYLKV